MQKKRTEIERQNDLIAISQLYLRGLTQQQIAVHLGLSQQQISYDIKEIVENWREEQGNNVADKIAIELEKISQVEVNAWESFEKSKSRAKKTTTTEKDGQIEKTNTTSYERYGDPKFLEVLLQCSSDRRKLLGLDAAIKLQTVAPNQFESMTTEELEQRLIQLQKDIENYENQDDIL